jgi:hypothetical protein
LRGKIQRLLSLKEVLSILTCLRTLSRLVRLLTNKGGVPDKMVTFTEFVKVSNEMQLYLGFYSRNSKCFGRSHAHHARNMYSFLNKNQDTVASRWILIHIVYDARNREPKTSSNSQQLRKTKKN